MPESADRHINKIRSQAEIRAKVAAAIHEAIAQIAMLNHAGPTNALRAIRAADEVLASDVAFTSVEELSVLAQDAAEAAFADVGFNSAKLVADLHVITQTKLANADQS
ncbi:MAG: hypothetical protein JWM46_690 [Candidatus Kaiserbacteria bacterium]|nr:hypothetical protein [Candidatus Kaiserbacteria bacterium]